MNGFLNGRSFTCEQQGGLKVMDQADGSNTSNLLHSELTQSNSFLINRKTKTQVDLKVTT